MIRYYDMDGVLADFNAEPNAVERYAVEKNFFKNLKPINPRVEYVREMIREGYDVRVISASPHNLADRDKMLWLKNIFPNLHKTKYTFVE